MTPIDILDVLAAILGVVYSVRRQWVRRREPSDFPGVGAELFERWKSMSVRAYSVLMNACFGKLLLDFAWFYGARASGVEVTVMRGIAMAIDLAWLVAMFWGLTLRARAATVRRQLPPPREAA